ncbi:MAG: hypothetical protein KDJ35_06465 [Alphaproteobacteria bacterium]|nr:hypothetical protein [Alphaproteobacteria bacterium]
MPRKYSFEHYLEGSDSQKFLLARPIYGENELTEEEIEKRRYRIISIHAGLNWPRWHFERSVNLKGAEFEKLANEMFASLNKHSTGKWLWVEEEEWRGELRLRIHIERESDQKYFNKLWGKYFEYKKDVSSLFGDFRHGLAVIYGALKAEYGLSEWLMVYCGLKLTFNDVNALSCEVRCEIPEIEEALYHDWIKDERVVSRFDRKTNSFFLKFKDAESVKEFEKWELDHFAFKKDHFDKTRKKYIEGGGRWGMPDNNICRVVSRYPASTQKLTEKWFSVVSPSITEDGSSTVWHFEAAYEEDYYKQAPIPEDFLKYLSGEIELSDVNLPYDNTRPDRGYPDFHTP